MNNITNNTSFAKRDAFAENRCASKSASKRFNSSIGREARSASLVKTGNASQAAVTKTTFERLSNSSSPAMSQVDVQITRFALQTITQIVGLITHLLNGLGLETGIETPSTGGKPTGNAAGGMTGGLSGAAPKPDHPNTRQINIPLVEDTKGTIVGQPNFGETMVFCETVVPGGTIVINLPGGSASPIQPEHPAGPENPTDPETPAPPRETPKAGDTYIRLGPIDQASKAGELSGAERPGPREISNAVVAQDGKQTSNANNASDLLWSWGQFIDHDMILTKEGEQEANIKVPRGDAKFDPANTGNSYVPFKRSEATTDANGNREQINEQTALIDGSMVYGATAEKTAELRTFEGGKLKIDDSGNLLPDEKEVVLSGDPRAAEQPGLLSLQTLFVREHNRQATMISERYPDWSDDQVFDEAKRMVTNQIQAITYNEFLPTLLGGEAPVTSRVQYDPATVDGQVSSEFSTAAFRLGHTMVNETIAFKDDEGNLKQATLDEVFFKPEFTQREGIGSVLSGQSDQKAQAVDPMIVDALRNRLFGPPQAGGPGMDLASLNIQRGRDHNVATYNDMREAMGYHRIESFDDPVFQDGVGERLAQVYGSPDEIDLWVGGLAEKQLGNSMLGETFTAIVDEQFGRTAAADPNFYTKTASSEEIAWLNQLSLADVVRANSSDAFIDNTPFKVD